MYRCLIVNYCIVTTMHSLCEVNWCRYSDSSFLMGTIQEMLSPVLERWSVAIVSNWLVDSYSFLCILYNIVLVYLVRRLETGFTVWMNLQRVDIRGRRIHHFCCYLWENACFRSLTRVYATIILNQSNNKKSTWLYFVQACRELCLSGAFI